MFFKEGRKPSELEHLAKVIFGRLCSLYPAGPYECLKIPGGLGSLSNVVGIVGPLVGIGLPDFSKSWGAMPYSSPSTFPSPTGQFMTFK